MKYCYILFLAFLVQVSAFANLSINEIKVNPDPGTNDLETQALNDCNNPGFGKAWIELYNNSKCDTIFMDCHVISVQTSADNGGTFAFPQGTFIEPLGFLVIGGGDVPEADFVLSDFCNTPNLCGADTWELEKDFGWVGIYNSSGNVIDAVFYTENSGQATSINNHPNFDFTPCIPDKCGIIPELIKPNEMTPGTQIIYGGRVPDIGTTLARAEDGQPGWQTDANPTPGDCNGVCAIADDLEAFIEVVQDETCEQANGIAYVEIAGGTQPYLIAWEDGQTGDTAFNLSEGLIQVIVTDAEGCTDVDTSSLFNEGSTPDLSIEPEDPAIFLGDFEQLTLNSSNPLSSATWSPGSGLSCQNCLSPLAGPGVTTTYTVHATDVYECEQTATVTIQVIDDAASVFIPNAFTPDQEANHTLYVRSPRIETMEFRIYDRWGNEVFYTTDQERGWNGTSPGGQRLPSGVFVYQLKVTLENGNQKVLNGNIHLIR